MRQEDEPGELSWRHRRTLRCDYSGAYQAFRLTGRQTSPTSWNSDNTEDHVLARQDFDEQHMCTYCCWLDHIATQCDTPHYKCSCDRTGWCRVFRHH